MSVKLLTEYHLEFLSLKGGCTGPSESTRVKIPHCWKSRVMAQIIYDNSGQELYKYVVGGMIEIKGIEEITLTYSLTGWSISLFCHLCYKHDFLDNGIKFK